MSLLSDRQKLALPPPVSWRGAQTSEFGEKGCPKPMGNKKASGDSCDGAGRKIIVLKQILVTSKEDMCPRQGTLLYVPFTPPPKCLSEVLCARGCLLPVRRHFLPRWSLSRVPLQPHVPSTVPKAKAIPALALRMTRGPPGSCPGGLDGPQPREQSSGENA